MPMRRVGGWVAGVLVAGLLASACVLGERSARADDDEFPDVSAEQLDDPTEDGSILQMLEPEEREALERSQMTGVPAEPQKPAAREKEGVGDTVGKVGLSIASVALSIASVIAPLFFF